MRFTYIKCRGKLDNIFETNVCVPRCYHVASVNRSVAYDNLIHHVMPKFTVFPDRTKKPHTRIDQLV